MLSIALAHDPGLPLSGQETISTVCHEARESVERMNQRFVPSSGRSEIFVETHAPWIRQLRRSEIEAFQEFHSFSRFAMAIALRGAAGNPNKRAGSLGSYLNN